MSARDLERDLHRVAALTEPFPLHVERPAQAERTRLARARGELSRVQRAEFALLLRRAAARRLAGASASDGGQVDGLAEVLELARVEGWRWPQRLERLALRLAARPSGEWPGALRLARAAHALAPSLASRELVADALAAEGRPREALGALVHAFARLPRGLLPRRLFAALDRHLAHVERVVNDPCLARSCADLRRSLAAERAA